MSQPKLPLPPSERSRPRLSPLLDPARRAELGQLMTSANEVLHP